MSDNDDLVSQFMAFSGCDDPAKAASYLEMSGGDLQTAVGLFMDNEFGGSSAAGPVASPQEIRAPDQVQRMRLMDDNVVLQDPTLQMMNAMMEEQLRQSAFMDQMVGARAAVDAAIMDEEKDEEVEILDDDEEVGAQPPRLSDMFAPPNHLIHRAGGFQGARAMAKDSRRWLLVNIQKDSEFSCHALNRDVWRDELVENLIREGFIFWQQMDVHPEGRTFIERYQVNDFPHISIIDPRTARLLWRREGWTQENPMTAELFAELAMDFCSRNSFDKPPQAPKPVASSSRPTKRPVYEMSEDEQMQAAMQASMGDVITIDDDTKPAAEEERKESLNDKLIAMDVGAEPSTGPRIQLRMPDGKRIVRRFQASDPVKMIYAFVAQSNDEARSGKEFGLMAGFPPSDLTDKIDQSIEECQLSGQAISVRWKDS